MNFVFGFIFSQAGKSLFLTILFSHYEKIVRQKENEFLDQSINSCVWCVCSFGNNPVRFRCLILSQQKDWQKDTQMTLTIKNVTLPCPFYTRNFV